MNRSDAGQNIVMRHTNIQVAPGRVYCSWCLGIIGEDCDCKQGGDPFMETDKQRKARTDLSSLRMTDDESKKVQKTPNRVTLDSMLAKIVSEEFIHPNVLPSMTICLLGLRNGFVLLGKATPADPDNFDEELGRKFAKEDAIRQMWQIEAYLLREEMSKPDEAEGAPV